MAYMRPLDDDAGLYFFPDDEGIRFLCFPQHSGETIPDEMLDILLSKMSNEEIARRKKHGDVLLKLLKNGDNDTYNKNKSFFKEDKEW
jgi:hypothetical protein